MQPLRIRPLVGLDVVTFVSKTAITEVQCCVKVKYKFSSVLATGCSIYDVSWPYHWMFVTSKLHQMTSQSLSINLNPSLLFPVNPQNLTSRVRILPNHIQISDMVSKWLTRFIASYQHTNQAHVFVYVRSLFCYYSQNLYCFSSSFFLFWIQTDIVQIRNQIYFQSF
jgi:hypothetical protein